MLGFGNKGLGSVITLLVTELESHNSKHNTNISSPAFTQKNNLPYIKQTDVKMDMNILFFLFIILFYYYIIINANLQSTPPGAISKRAKRA
jgi:hypothetical protein